MKKLMLAIILMVASVAAQAHYLTLLLPSGDFLILNSTKPCEKIYGVKLQHYGFLMGRGKQVNACWDYMPGNKKVKVFYSTGNFEEYPVRLFKNSAKFEQHELGD